MPEAKWTWGLNRMSIGMRVAAALLTGDAGVLASRGNCIFKKGLLLGTVNVFNFNSDVEALRWRLESYQYKDSADLVIDLKWRMISTGVRDV